MSAYERIERLILSNSVDHGSVFDQDDISARIAQSKQRANQFIQTYSTPGRRLALTRKIGIVFQEEADRAEGDLDEFCRRVVHRINNLRDDMPLFEPDTYYPRVFSGRIVTWLNRVIATKQGDQIISLDSLLYFYVDALLEFMAAQYGRDEPGELIEDELLNEACNDPRFSQFPGDNTDLLRLVMAASRSLGLTLKNKSEVIAWGVLAGAFASMDVPVPQKIDLVARLFSEVYAKVPAIDPIRFVHEIMQSKMFPSDSLSAEIRSRLNPYFKLLRDGEITDIDTVDQLIAKIDTTSNTA